MISPENLEFVTFLSGATTSASLITSLFFLKFWRKTRDQFFLMFSFAFLLLGLERCLFILSPLEDESRSWIYLVRLTAFLIIIVAIIQKNRRG